MKVLSLFVIIMAIILMGGIVGMEATLAEKMIAMTATILSIVIVAIPAIRKSLYSYTIIDFEHNKSSYGISTIKNINKDLYWAAHCAISSILLLISMLCMLTRIFVQLEFFCELATVISLICFVIEIGIALVSILDIRNLFTNCKVDCKLCVAMYIIPILTFCSILIPQYSEKIGEDSLLLVPLISMVTVIIACSLFHYHNKLQKQCADSIISCDAKLVCTLESGEEIKTRAYKVFLSFGDRAPIIFYYKHGLLFKKELKRLEISVKGVNGNRNKKDCVGMAKCIKCKTVKDKIVIQSVE